MMINHPHTMITNLFSCYVQTVEIIPIMLGCETIMIFFLQKNLSGFIPWIISNLHTQFSVNEYGI